MRRCGLLVFLTSILVAAVPSTTSASETKWTCATDTVCTFGKQPPPSGALRSNTTRQTRLVVFDNVCIPCDGQATLPLFVHSAKEEELLRAALLEAPNAAMAVGKQPFAAIDLSNATVAAHFAPVTYTVVPGTTYLTLASYGNIAHGFQSLSCEISTILASGVEDIAQLNFAPAHLGIESIFLRKPPVFWIEFYVQVLLDVMRDRWPNLNVDAVHLRGRTNSGLTSRCKCFERLGITRRGACGGHALQASSFPSGMGELWRTFRSKMFEQGHLDESRPCVRTIVVYGRNEQKIRRMVNVDEVVATLQRLLPHTNVTRMTAIPTDPTVQVALFNGIDVIISMHSASMYNTINLPSSSMVFELGAQTWWGKAMASQLAEAGIHTFEFINKIVRVPFNSSVSSYVAQNPDVYVPETTIEYIAQQITTKRTICSPASQSQNVGTTQQKPTQEIPLTTSSVLPPSGQSRPPHKSGTALPIAVLFISILAIATAIMLACIAANPSLRRQHRPANEIVMT